jgi:hypothetical protein
MKNSLQRAHKQTENIHNRADTISSSRNIYYIPIYSMNNNQSTQNSGKSKTWTHSICKRILDERIISLRENEQKFKLKIKEGKEIKRIKQDSWP